MSILIRVCTSSSVLHKVVAVVVRTPSCMSCTARNANTFSIVSHLSMAAQCAVNFSSQPADTCWRLQAGTCQKIADNDNNKRDKSDNQQRVTEITHHVHVPAHIKLRKVMYRMFTMHKSTIEKAARVRTLHFAHHAMAQQVRPCPHTDYSPAVAAGGAPHV